jgi:hypothetical protein
MSGTIRLLSVKSLPSTCLNARIDFRKHDHYFDDRRLSQLYDCRGTSVTLQWLATRCTPILAAERPTGAVRSTSGSGYCFVTACFNQRIRNPACVCRLSASSVRRARCSERFRHRRNRTGVRLDSFGFRDIRSLPSFSSSSLALHGLSLRERPLAGAALATIAIGADFLLRTLTGLDCNERLATRVRGHLCRSP